MFFHLTGCTTAALPQQTPPPAGEGDDLHDAQRHRRRQRPHIQRTMTTVLMDLWRTALARVKRLDGHENLLENVRRALGVNLSGNGKVDLQSPGGTWRSTAATKDLETFVLLEEFLKELYAILAANSLLQSNLGKQRRFMNREAEREASVRKNLSLAPQRVNSSSRNSTSLPPGAAGRAFNRRVGQTKGASRAPGGVGARPPPTAAVAASSFKGEQRRMSRASPGPATVAMAGHAPNPPPTLATATAPSQPHAPASAEAAAPPAAVAASASPAEVPRPAE